MMSRGKYLLRCKSARRKDIVIPNGETLIVGRSPITGIKNTRVSKRHLKLTSTDKGVICEAIGSNRAFVNGQPLVQFDKKLLLNKEVLNLIEGELEYQLIMDEKNENTATPGKEPKMVHSNHWSQGLFRAMEDPELKVLDDEKVCVIKDKYPKATHHFLVLPKEHLSTLNDLTASHTTLVEHMVQVAEDHLIKDLKDFEFKMGFHAIPSMAQVHMHVISQDFNSPCLKTKKHWNSFNTDYFILAKDVLSQIKSEGKVNTSSAMKSLLSENLVCNRCSLKPKNIPDLKQHLLKHFKAKQK